jgi:hypothetical protein
MKSLVSALFAVAACGSSPAAPDAPSHADARGLDARAPDARPDGPPDASGPDLACLGQPPPSTAPDPLPVGGKLFAVDHYNVAPVTGGTVVLRHHGSDAVLAQATTAADGSFAMTVASGGAPVDAYFAISADGYRPTRVEPGDPLSGGENALMLVAADDELARWYAAAGTTYAAGARTLITASVDCANATLGGSTVAIAPAPATTTYYDDVSKQWSASLAASTNGFALVTGAAATVTATASIGTTQLPPRTVTVPAATLTLALLPPRT